MGPSQSQLRYSLALQAVGTLYQGRGEAHADTGTSITSYCLRIGIPRGSNVLLGVETAHNLPSFWNFPEVKEMIGLGHLKLVRFDQSQMEHARRKPTTILGNLPGLEQLDGLRDSSRRSDPLPRGLQESMEASKDWASWAPGLVMALKEALRAHLHQRDQCLAQRIHKLNVEEWKACQSPSSPLSKISKSVWLGWIAHIGGRTLIARPMFFPWAWWAHIRLEGMMVVDGRGSTSWWPPFPCQCWSVPTPRWRRRSTWLMRKQRQLRRM